MFPLNPGISFEEANETLSVKEMRWDIMGKATNKMVQHHANLYTRSATVSPFIYPVEGNLHRRDRVGHVIEFWNASGEHGLYTWGSYACRLRVFLEAEGRVMQGNEDAWRTIILQLYTMYRELRTPNMAKMHKKQHATEFVNMLYRLSL